MACLIWLRARYRGTTYTRVTENILIYAVGMCHKSRFLVNALPIADPNPHFKKNLNTSIWIHIQLSKLNADPCESRIRNHRKIIVGYLYCSVIDSFTVPVFAPVRSLGEGTLKLPHLMPMVSQHVILQIAQRTDVGFDVHNPGDAGDTLEVQTFLPPAQEVEITAEMGPGVAIGAGFRHKRGQIRLF
jgi:hypothetical protein